MTTQDDTLKPYPVTCSFCGASGQQPCRNSKGIACREHIVRRNAKADAALYGPTAEDRVTALAQEVERLRAKVEIAATIFDEYEQLHLEKGTLDGDMKARRNALYAEEMREALATSGIGGPTMITQDDTVCPSCEGFNIYCPEGCGRDPVTGELDEMIEAGAKALQSIITHNHRKASKAVLEASGVTALAQEVERLRKWLKATADIAETPGADPAAFMELVGKGARGFLQSTSGIGGLS